MVQPTTTPIQPTSTALQPSATPIQPTTTSAPPTATPINLPTSTAIVPTTETTFDDKNNAFAYSGNWQNTSNTKAYKGSYKSTKQNGASVTFTFTGQSFSILYKGGISYSKFDMYIDGQMVGTFDEKLDQMTFQKRWDYPGQLAPGQHTLKLVFKVTNSTINNGSLDAVIVR
jgi:hypothetical protein